MQLAFCVFMAMLGSMTSSMDAAYSRTNGINPFLSYNFDSVYIFYSREKPAIKGSTINDEIIVKDLVLPLYLLNFVM